MTYYGRDKLIDVIRQAFRSTDDSHMCQDVLPPAVKRPMAGGVSVDRFRSNSSLDENDEFYDRCYSPDIQLEESRRPRTRTNVELENLKSQRATQTKVVTVRWKDPTGDPPILEAMPIEKLTNRTSYVSQMVMQTPAAADNPFQQYAKFEATVTSAAPSKHYKVFLPNAEGGDTGLEPISIRVGVLASARVADLVGLVCYLYTTNGKQPSLSSDVSRYQMYMADDDGDIEWDLPPLSLSQPVGRFGFSSLAFVDEKARNGSDHDESETEENVVMESVSVYFTDGQWYRLEFPNLDDVTVDDLRTKALEMHAPQQRLPRNCHFLVDAMYIVEKLTKPDEPLPLDVAVRQTDCTEFVVLRQNSSRGEYIGCNIPDLRLSGTRTASLTSVDSDGIIVGGSAVSPLTTSESAYSGRSGVRVRHSASINFLTAEKQEYQVTLNVNRFVKNQINLAISGDRLELSTGKKITTYLIGGAETIREKHGRRTFRVLYRSGGRSNDWHIIEMEADAMTAEHICRKVNDIADQLASDARHAYLFTSKPKKITLLRWKVGLPSQSATIGGSPGNSSPKNNKSIWPLHRRINSSE